MAKKKATTTKKTTGKAKAPAPRPVAKKKAAPAPKAKKAPAKPVRPAAKKNIPLKKTAPKKTAPKKVAAKKAPVKKAPPAKPAPAKKAAPPKPAPVAKKPVLPAKAAAPQKTQIKPTAPLKPAPEAAKPAAPVKPVAPAKAVRAPKVKEPIVAVMTGLEPLGGPSKTLKRALKERFQQEFYLRATPGSLYDLISSPSGFSEWFCDDVDVSGDEFTFKWGMDSQQAECLSRKFGEMIRFRWLDDEDPGAFFELRIRIDPMTNETCLVVTDHAWPKDMDEAKALWESQIHTLARVLGA